MSAIVCGLTAGDRSPHLNTLMSAALRALQPAQSSEQRMAVVLLSTMWRQCNNEEREMMQAAGFVEAAIPWLPSFRSVNHETLVRVLKAACALAQPQQLPPFMAVLLPDLMTANEKRLEAVLIVLLHTSQPWNLQLFGSKEAAAGVVTRLVQLLTHPSDEILRTAWLICCQLSVNAINRQLLLELVSCSRRVLSRRWPAVRLISAPAPFFSSTSAPPPEARPGC